MARTFVRASSQKLDLASAVATAAPCTIAGWYKLATTSGDFSICGVAKDTVDTDYVELLIGGGAVKVGARAISAAEGNGTALSTVAATGSVWQHAAAVFTSASSRAAFLNGGSKGTNSTTINPAGLNHTSIGRVPTLTPADHFDGDLAEVGFWTAALDDAEIAALAAGVSPLLVRPSALIAYWPIIGTFSPEIDRVGRFELTVSGATAAAHPPIWYPSSSPHIAHVVVVVPVDQLAWRPIMPDLLLDTSVECVASGFTPRPPANPTDPTPT